MPDIKFYCPECRSKLAADGRVAGYFVNCPECDRRIQIPDASASTPSTGAHARYSPRLGETPGDAAGTTQKIELPDEAALSLRERIAVLEHEREAFEAALRMEQSRSEGTERLESKAADLLQQLETAQRQLEETQQRAQRAERERQTLQNRLEQLELERKRMRHEIEEARASAAALREALQDAKRRANEQQEKCAALESTCEALRREKEQWSDLQARVAALEKENQALRGQGAATPANGAPGPARGGAGATPAPPAGSSDSLAPQNGGASSPIVEIAGTSMYSPEASPPHRHRGKRWAFVTVSLLVAIITIAVLTQLRFVHIFTRSTPSLSKQAPSAGVATAPGTSPPPVAPATAGGETSAGEARRLSAAQVIDDILITVHGATVRPVQRVNHVGNSVYTESPYLVLDVSLKNMSRDRSVFMLHTWDQATLTDNRDRVQRPAFPARYAVDRILGTLGATELKPGQEVQDVVVFEEPPPDAESFKLEVDPGFWKETPGQGYTPISHASLELAFDRNQLTAALPSVSAPASNQE